VAKNPPIYRKLLVAVSSEDSDRQTVRYAANLLLRSVAVEICFVHARRRDEPFDLEAFVRDAAADWPAAPRLSFHSLRGPREDTLLAFSVEHECDLILIGHRKRRSGRRSLARRLAMNAPCSVWMAPEGSAAEVSRMLVPVDLSERSAEVLAEATRVAAAFGLQSVDTLHVYFEQSAAPRDEEYEERVHDREEAALWELVARVELHGVDLNPLFEESVHVADTIRRVAEQRQADLIVMGTRGRSRSAGILLGSETEETIVETPIPVLAVKRFGSRLSFLQALLDKRFREREGPKFT
jgi:nucleotide-binding universal stress UspA family protein